MEIESMVKAIKIHINGDCEMNGDYCPYRKYANCSDMLMADVLDILNEVETERNAPTVGGWVSVKDKLPDIDNDYIVCAINEDGEQFVTSDTYIDKVRGWYLIDANTDSKVTHWMSLPEPPKEDNHD